MGVIHILPNPALPPSPPRDLIHHRHQKAVEEVPDPDPAREERRPEALHLLRRLVVEELEEADRVEHVGHPEQHVLRQQVEDAHGDHLVGPGDPPGLDHAHPPHLHRVGDGDGRDLDDEADAEPLQQGDAAGVAGAALHEGDEVAVVHGDGEEHGEGDEAAEGGGRDLEGGAEVAVEGGALLHEEGVDLSPDGAGD